MLTKSQLEEILHIALQTGAGFAEIFMEEETGTSILLEDEKIEKIVSGTETGAGIRIISGTQMSYACSSELSFDNLKKIAGQAAEGISGNSKKKEIKLKINAPKGKNRTKNVGIEKKIALVKICNKTARSYGDKIKQVTVSYADSNQGITIANSNGLYVEDNRRRTRYFVNVIAEKNGVLQTGYEAPGGTGGFELIKKYPPELMARQATQRALLMLGAPHAPSGKMMVVLTAGAGGTLIHEACGHGLEADFIMKGTSVFTGKIGKQVTSNLITVIDDPTIKGNFGSFNFDDEGTPAQKNILIENGILKSYMTDYYTAKNLGIQKTSNGRRESFHTKPVPRMTNTYIARGKTDPQTIINSVKYGLLVKKMGGGEVNVVNGDFVFEVTEGYLIENGKIKHPVRGAILTGNGPQVLQMIDMVGSDLDFQTGVCGKYDHAPVSDGQPTLRIPEIVVGGRN